MITKSRVEKCLATIEAIASSPYVDQYLVGHTALSASIKGDQYRSKAVGFEHLVILVDKMTLRDSLFLEEALQLLTMKSDDGSASCRKYHAEKRANARYFNSDGGTARDPDIKQFSVYMAWWNK